LRLIFVLFAFLVLSFPARAGMICTLVADADTGAVLVEEGDCDRRVTPASTFKVPLAVMGFDAGLLIDPHSPSLPFQPGYADWGGPNWRVNTDPTHWMTHSVVWFSQLLTPRLGADELTRYAQALGYGNADFSGDPGRNNGLERAWIGSSLKISPREQVAFLARLVTLDLPVSRPAITSTLAILQSPGTFASWQLWGKTGSAFPRNADYSLDRARGWGWYVGWAQRDGRRLVFARLDQDEARNQVSGGLRARDAFLAAWPTLAPRP